MRRVHVDQTDGDVFTADVPPNIVNVKEDGVTNNPEVEPSPHNEVFLYPQLLEIKKEFKYEYESCCNSHRRK